MKRYEEGYIDGFMEESEDGEWVMYEEARKEIEKGHLAVKKLIDLSVQQDKMLGEKNIEIEKLKQQIEEYEVEQYNSMVERDLIT